MTLLPTNKVQIDTFTDLKKGQDPLVLNRKMLKIDEQAPVLTYNLKKKGYI